LHAKTIGIQRSERGDGSAEAIPIGSPPPRGLIAGEHNGLIQEDTVSGTINQVHVQLNRIGMVIADLDQRVQSNVTARVMLDHNIWEDQHRALQASVTTRGIVVRFTRIRGAAGVITTVDPTLAQATRLDGDHA
jgi:hypothetical protein